MTREYSNLDVCTTHITLRGLYEGKEHRCACVPVDEGWRDREWGGHDIAGIVALCHLCARAVIQTRSRWSWLGCETCRRVNHTIAEAISGDPRSQILPLGIHSMMNGRTLSGEDLGDHQEVEGFIESLMGMFGLQGRLVDWGRREGERLAKASGHNDQDVVPLDVWLDSNPASLGASADAMCRFLDEDNLPGLRDLDELRAARQRHLEFRG